MAVWRSTLLRRQVRIVFYVLVVLVLFLVRGPEHWRDAIGWRGASDGADAALVVAGRANAPTLLDTLVRGYLRDYPEVAVELRDRGTAHALEALWNGEATVALLARPLLASERALFVESFGAAPICEPIALAGLAVLAARSASVDSLSWTHLEALVRGSPHEGTAERLYVEDPNLGVWDALLEHFPDVPTTPSAGAPIYFVGDRDELFVALREDPSAIGVVSSIFLPGDEAPAGLGLVAVRGEAARAAALPTHLQVGHGVYPLRHRFYLACRADARGEVAKFVTFASSARGQRLVERAGFLPARQVLREILLDDRPMGAR